MQEWSDAVEDVSVGTVTAGAVIMMGGIIGTAASGGTSTPVTAGVVTAGALTYGAGLFGGLTAELLDAAGAKAGEMGDGRYDRGICNG